MFGYRVEKEVARVGETDTDIMFVLGIVASS